MIRHSGYDMWSLTDRTDLADPFWRASWTIGKARRTPRSLIASRTWSKWYALLLAKELPNLRICCLIHSCLFPWRHTTGYAGVIVRCSEGNSLIVIRVTRKSHLSIHRTASCCTWFLTDGVNFLKLDVRKEISFWEMMYLWKVEYGKLELTMRSAKPGGLRGGIRSRLARGDAGRILVKDSLLPAIWRKGVIGKAPSEVEVSYCFRLRSCIENMINLMDVTYWRK